jgi:hypothetical protein
VGRKLLVALVALVALLTGCANDPVVELADWELVTPDGAVRPIHMPVHVDRLLAPVDSTYVLRARVALPQALSGRALTLALPYLDARTALQATART